jgi:hypothetical protein
LDGAALWANRAPHSRTLVKILRQFMGLFFCYGEEFEFYHKERICKT